MENGIFAQQRKKSKTLVMVRLVVAFLFIAAGAGILLGQYLVSERNCVTIDADHPFYMMGADDYAKITTDQHYDTGIYFYTNDEDKADSYLYFIFLDDEIVIAESKSDYSEDDEGVERSFKGVVTELTDKADFAENLTYYFDDVDESEAYTWLPDYYLSIESPANTAPWGWGVLILGVLVLVINLLAYRASGKLKKRMDAYGVDELAISRFEQELMGGDTDSLGKVTLTSNWIYNKTTGAVSLFPLKEIVWVHQTITQNRYNGIPTGKTYNLQVYFSDGETISIPGKKAVIEGAIEIFTRRCPQALIGFSPERQKAWNKDKDSIIRASRERAAELNMTDDRDPYADDDSRYATTDSFYDRSEETSEV